METMQYDCMQQAELLAAYKATGFTPDEIVNARKAMNAALGLACEAQAARNEVVSLRKRMEQEYREGAKYAIYEICKEADIPGSQKIRDSEDTIDGMCARVADKIKSPYAYIQPDLSDPESTRRFVSETQDVREQEKDGGLRSENESHMGNAQ